MAKNKNQDAAALLKELGAPTPQTDKKADADELAQQLEGGYSDLYSQLLAIKDPALEAFGDEGGPTMVEASARNLDDLRKKLQLVRVGAFGSWNPASMMSRSQDTSFFFTVCFQTAEQAADFLAQTGWDQIGEHHLDGLALAQLLNVTLKPVEPFHVEEDLAKTVLRLVREVM